MNTYKILKGSTCVLAFVLLAWQQEIFAQDSSSNKIEEFIKKSKNPTSWLSWGADLRVRDEYLNNVIALNESAPKSEQNWIRIRTRLWSSIKPLTNFAFNTRLTWEGREWTREPYKRGVGSGFDWQDGIIDIFNIKYSEAFGLPLTAIIGRQDMMIGDGWLVGDGTPLDGSRTYFFDAARLTYNLKEQNTTIDAIYIDQSGHNDRWLPPINRLNNYLIEQSEKGVIFYLSNKSIKEANIDAYFMYKHMDAVLANGDNGNLYTMGSRVAGVLYDHWSYRVEGAYQTGRKNRKDVDAYGVNTCFAYLFKDTYSNQLRFTFEHLSGDDPNTPDNEQFDPLWGRWPRWSELYIYSMIYETRPSEISNFNRFGPGWSFKPHKKLDFIADYFAVFADESRDPGLPNSSLFGTGTFRGHLVETQLKFKVSEHLDGHLLGEYFFPGDFYAYHDSMIFLRAQLNFTY